MVRPNRDKLSGIVEVDEAYIGGPEEDGKRGRGTQNKVLTAVAVEINDNKVGRIRLSAIESASSESLHPFIEETIEKGSTIVSDGWLGYKGLQDKGYSHQVLLKKDSEDDNILPHVHTVVSLLKRWILGTLQGSCSADHMPYYFDEFCFRFNRRASKSRGLLFYRLLENAVELNPVTYSDLINR